jgi:NAD(P)-dependent dehydrogenase (short-subunit alcohol dehydrogenase family)
VLATARDIKSLADLSERYGDQVKLFAMDVTDEAAVANAVMAAVDVFGSLDSVINNAGYGNLSSVEDTPLSEFRAQIETNLFVGGNDAPACCRRNGRHHCQMARMSMAALSADGIPSFSSSPSDCPYRSQKATRQFTSQLPRLGFQQRS